MNWTQLVGFFGTAIAIVAYVPQIIHLSKEKCAAGISLKMYSLWLLSSSLLLVNAVAISSSVFVIYQLANLCAISIIIFFARKYQDQACPTHLIK